MTVPLSPAVPDGPAFDPTALHPQVQAFLERTPRDDAATRTFLAAVETPLVEPGAATFLWQGEAERVVLVRWIHTGVDRCPLARIAGTSLWHLRLPVEDGGRFEYKLAVAGPADEAWILDPLNPARAGDPFGENSEARTWGYEPPAWSQHQGAPAGRVETLTVESPTFGEARHERIYLPAAYRAGASHPLLIVHDGRDYVSYAGLSVSLDNLIAAGDVPPLVAVLAQTGDRMSEYPRGRRHARYLVNELLPAVAARHAVSADPRERVLLGASLGAVASLATAFRYPGVFGGLILKSGSFVLDPAKLAQRPHPVFHRTARLVRAIRRAPDLPETRAYVSTGELEGLAEENRALADVLRERGVDVMFRSSWDGHHWHNWRDHLRDGLMWVLRRSD